MLLNLDTISRKRMVIIIAAESDLHFKIAEYSAYEGPSNNSIMITDN